MFTQEELNFISANKDANTNELRLKYAKKSDLDYPFLINQIESGKKANTKIPELSQLGIVLPPSQNLEQCSSEITAKYKASLVNGKSGVDLTGGFGIDSIYFSKKFDEFTYIEPNSELYKITVANLKHLNLNITPNNTSAEAFINTVSGSMDFVYLDPSRRKDGNKSVFLDDYLPNVVDIQEKLRQVGNKIMVKTSPLLDIKDTLSKLHQITEIHVVAIKNEVKEVLYLLDQNTSKSSITINTINFTNGNESQNFNASLQQSQAIDITPPKSYIYEPNAAIMKSGLMNVLGNKFKLSKLHQNSHLFTSDDLYVDFPGRIFKLQNTVAYQKKDLQQYKKANITTRNFPASVAQIRKKTKIKEGGDIYLFATTLINDKPVILDCRKIEA